MDTIIKKEHGNGGKQTFELINEVFKKAFENKFLEKADDATSLFVNSNDIAVSTDSFVVKPIFFEGGDIGKLSVCGTSNDLAVSGYRLRYLTTSFIIEEGFKFDDLTRIAESIGEYTRKMDAFVVAGDTKVVEKGACDGIFINTTGIGEKIEKFQSFIQVKDGQSIIASGDIGRHGACIYSHNQELGLEKPITSDCDLLYKPISEILGMYPNSVSYIKDLTRGGLATALNEISIKSGISIEINEEKLPISNEVLGISDILGLDPLYLACEGRFVIIVEDIIKKDVIEILKKYNLNACEIGKTIDDKKQKVYLKTLFGGTRIVDMLYFEMLPRIC